MPLSDPNQSTGSPFRRPSPTGSSGFGSALSLYDQLNAGQSNYLNNQGQNLNFQMNALGPAYGAQSGALRQNYNSSVGLNNLAAQATGADRASIGRQRGYLDSMYGVDQAKYGTNVGYQNALKGFAGQAYGIAGKTHTSVLEQLANQLADSQRQAVNEDKGVRSQATAAGAYTAQGTRDDVATVEADRASRQANNAQQRLQEGYSYDQTGVAYRRDLSGIDNTIANMGYDLQASGLSTAEQKAKLGDRMAQLDIQAKTFGLKNDQLESQLSQGLASLNLDQVMSVGQLMDSLNSNDYQKAQLAQQIIGQALQYGTYMR